MVYVVFLFLFMIFSLRYNWWRIPVGNHKPRVLMYHMIKGHCDSRKRNKWRVKPQDFERQMAWLARHGWNACTMSELMEMETIPPKTFCITFDDGYRDNLTNALPVLQKYGFKATIYLVPGYRKNRWESFETGRYDALLDEKEIKTMLATGMVEFGSHTLNHANLVSISGEQAIKEIELSRKKVEKITALPCKAFAYPYGKYNAELVGLVENSGYTSAVSVARGFFDKKKPFEIKRLGILGTESFFDFYLKFTRARNKL